MSWWYRRLVRPVLFAQDAEEIHRRTMRVLAWASRSELACDALESFFGAQELPSTVFGLRFPNPIGLAAGMDKEAEAVPAWAALGFGFCELGQSPGTRSPAILLLDSFVRSLMKRSLIGSASIIPARK